MGPLMGSVDRDGNDKWDRICSGALISLIEGSHRSVKINIIWGKMEHMVKMSVGFNYFLES